MQLREELIAEVGCPDDDDRHALSSTGRWRTSLRYPAGLIDTFEWERALDGGGLFGDRNVRTVVKEPVGVVGAITPSNFPVEVILNKLGPALATGNTVVLKPDPHTPWNATRLGRLIAEHTDIPRGRGQRRPDARQRRGRTARHRPAGRHDLVHRLHRGRQAADPPGRRDHEANLPRTRRQVGAHRHRGRQPGEDHPQCGRGVRARRAGLRARPPGMLVHRSLFDDAVAERHGRVRHGAGRRSGAAADPGRARDQRRAEASACWTRASRPVATVPRSPRAEDRSTTCPTSCAGGFYVQPTVVVGVDNSPRPSRRRRSSGRCW